MRDWIDENKTERPFAAGALAYILGKPRYYGCHYGMRSTYQWALDQFNHGYSAAERDDR